MDPENDIYCINVSVFIEAEDMTEQSASVLMQMVHKHLTNVIDDADYHFSDKIIHFIGKVEMKKKGDNNGDETK